MEVAVLDTIKVEISATSAARMASSPMLLAYNASRPRAWLNKYVQRKKWWVKIPTKFNWEKNNEIVSPIRTTGFGNCSASSLKTARLLDVVPDFEGGRDTTRYCRTYPSRTEATTTNAANYTSACTQPLQ